MKKHIIIKTQFTALHQWSECDIEKVSFLKELHRHIFFVKIKFFVKENNRELEFFECKNFIDTFINNKLLKPHINPNHSVCASLGNMSCEDIAETILSFLQNKKLPVCYVSVFEDNENGAEVLIDDQ
jgi:hypothetical protein